MLKIVSLNVERSRHLDRIIPFFQEEKPDVLCLQEVFEADLERLKKEMEMPFSIWIKDGLTYAPTHTTGEAGYSGIGIFSRTPFLKAESEYYYMPDGGIGLESKAERPFRETNAQAIAWVIVEKDGQTFTVASTHFTWTKDGYPDADQETDFLALRKILERIGPHVLTGDLNASRGRGMWEKFRALYNQDHIPASVLSTIDPVLHRVPGLVSVVDCLFTSESYFAEDVRIVEGLSDHKGVVASIGRR